MKYWSDGKVVAEAVTRFGGKLVLLVEGEEIACTDSIGYVEYSGVSWLAHKEEHMIDFYIHLREEGVL